MTHLSIVLSWHGAPVADRLVRLEDGMVLGDDVDAVVAFPSARFVVRRRADGWWVGSRRIHLGQRIVLRLGVIEVLVEPVEEQPALVRAEGVPDLLPLFLTLAVLLIVATAESAARVVDRHPELAEQLRALVLSPR